ncbi:hypothetical protein [Texcoconibacillus texcoconensis]|uniref:DUF3918 domain-containing protein n=1 Tax=Texcoconibacillus texcoconensis TaxID=1095777 RepID=A0A840QP84_9BACI|nr:hypothetical protein [Texcoconibacillus texcoconensis]MBB5173179.1 hypothetical protein [Texcoconibacillus texcoconensis]
MRWIVSMAAIGVGATAYAMTMDRKTRKRLKKRFEPMRQMNMTNMLPKNGGMRKLRKQMS